MAIKGPSKSGQPGSISKRKVKIALNGGRWKEKEEFRNHPPVESFFFAAFCLVSTGEFSKGNREESCPAPFLFSSALISFIFHLLLLYFSFILSFYCPSRDSFYFAQGHRYGNRNHDFLYRLSNIYLRTTILLFFPAAINQQQPQQQRQ